MRSQCDGAPFPRSDALRVERRGCDWFRWEALGFWGLTVVSPAKVLQLILTTESARIRRFSHTVGSSSRTVEAAVVALTDFTNAGKPEERRAPPQPH